LVDCDVVTVYETAEPSPSPVVGVTEIPAFAAGLGPVAARPTVWTTAASAMATIAAIAPACRRIARFRSALIEPHPCQRPRTEEAWVASRSAALRRPMFQSSALTDA
jgi:hypothetical protein